MNPVNRLSSVDTLHRTSYTLHPTPYTLPPTPYTLHPIPHTPHPTPYTLHPTPSPQPPKPLAVLPGATITWIGANLKSANLASSAAGNSATLLARPSFAEPPTLMVVGYAPTLYPLPGGEEGL